MCPYTYIEVIVGYYFAWRLCVKLPTLHIANLLCCPQAAIIKRTFAQNYILHQLCPYLDWKTLRTFMLWSTSLLNYCNALYPSMSTTWKPQLIQNTVAQIVIPWIRHDNAHMTLLLHRLHPLPVSFQIQFKMQVITYKTLQSIRLGYLMGCFPPTVSIFLSPII